MSAAIARANLELKLQQCNDQLTSKDAEVGRLQTALVSWNQLITLADCGGKLPSKRMADSFHL